MRNQKLRFTRVVAMGTACALLLVSGCAAAPGYAEPQNSFEASEADKTEAPADQADKKVTQAESTPQPTEEAPEPTSSGSAAERIGFITQSYDGGNIVEIPYIEYDGEMNPEIEAINRSYNQGYQAVYERFLQEKQEQEWIEIRSYPFTSEKYLQIVTTDCVYPNYGTEGNLASVNYDRNAKEWLSVADIMHRMGLEEVDILIGVGNNFVPETAGELIDSVKIAGFLLRDTPNGEMTEFLLNLTIQSPGGNGTWQGFYSYLDDGNDKTNDLTRLNNLCLFDPHDMDQMDPPMAYQQNTADGPGPDAPAPTEAAPAAPRTEATETQPASQNHLWITVPDITEYGVLLDSQENDAGVRSDTYLYDDIIRVAIERLPAGEYGAASVIARIAEWEGIPESELDAEESSLGSYPAFRFGYEKNGNWYLDLFVQTDSWDFRIHTEMPVDIPGMDDDEEYNYVEQTAILWFNTAELVS